MFRWLHVCLAAISLHAATLSAATAQSVRFDTYLSSCRSLVHEGKIEHARRVVARALTEFPGDETLLQLQAQVEEIFRRERGAKHEQANPIAPPLTAAVLPPASNFVPVAGAPFTLPEIGITLQWIPAGAFVMASTHGNDDETHVTISRGYWLGRTEVTQEQWRVVRMDNPNPSVFKGSTRPVENVAWVEAAEFVRTINARERAAGRLPDGYEYSLPTEAEWEYACRAGTTGPFPGEIGQIAWHETNSGGQTHPVAQLAPNAWGLYDMAGNVWEWCLDGPSPYSGRPVTDPIQAWSGSNASASHIIRGGGWNSSAGQCRSSQRSWRALSTTASGIGFRLALAPLRNPNALRTPATELSGPK